MGWHGALFESERGRWSFSFVTPLLSLAQSLSMNCFSVLLKAADRLVPGARNPQFERYLDFLQLLNAWHIVGSVRWTIGTVGAKCSVHDSLFG